METFKQIVAGPVWDGNLISKQERDRLRDRGWVVKTADGYNLVTATGWQVAATLGLTPRP